MSKRSIAWVLCLALCLTALPALGEGVVEAARQRQALLESQLQQAGAEDVQAWLDGALAQMAGVGAEWYVIALGQSGEYDFSAYAAGLLDYLEKQSVQSAATRQKYALALLTAGAGEEYAAAAARETIGQQGVMSWAYGLHLLNNGLEGSVTAQEAIEQLLALQLEDGGWTLRGTAADVDVTAMVLQALAPHAAQAEVDEAVGRALSLLSRRQLPEGDFASYGVANPESTAQVLTALSALNIDGLADERFIKQGTLLDGMARYRLPDGGYSHTLGGVGNLTATVQVFFALTAYERFARGQESIYLLDRRAAPAQPALTAKPGYRTVATAVIAGLAALGCLILLLTGKRHPRNFLAVLLAAAGLIAFVFLTDFQSADDYYAVTAVEKKDPVGTVTLSIRCDTAAARSDAEHVPQDGVMLPAVELPIARGDTVYTVLTDAARLHGVRLDASGPAGMVYVTGINYLYEYAFGDLSGWQYEVNGTSPGVGCDQYALADGDEILWWYSCELGADKPE